MERSIVLELQAFCSPSTSCHCSVYPYSCSYRAMVDLNLEPELERELLPSPLFEFSFPYKQRFVLVWYGEKRFPPESPLKAPVGVSHSPEHFCSCCAYNCGARRQSFSTSKSAKTAGQYLHRFATRQLVLTLFLMPYESGPRRIGIFFCMIAAIYRRHVSQGTYIVIYHAYAHHIR